MDPAAAALAVGESTARVCELEECGIKMQVLEEI